MKLHLNPEGYRSISWLEELLNMLLEVGSGGMGLGKNE